MRRFDQFYKTLFTEYRFIFRDWGVMLFLFIPLVYSVVYYCIYMPEVIRDMPVAVVDNSGTPESREFARRLNASPLVEVAYKPASLEEAKNMLFARDVCGIVVVPSGFGDKILSMEQAVVGVYADASYFLYYSRMFEAATAVVLDMGGDISVERFKATGMSERQAEAISSPVDVEVKMLFNPYNGYATFILPAAFVIFIQQFLMIGICVIGGTWEEKRIYRALVTTHGPRPSPLMILLGKATAYVALYIPMFIYLFAFLYKLFGFPMNGDPFEIAMLFVPYILSVVFMSLTLATLFKRRESPIVILSLTSIPLLMISGVSWPMEGIPEWMFAAGQIVPSSAAIKGFNYMQTAGASLSEMIESYQMLWILTGVYFLLAWYRISKTVDRHLKS